MEEGYGACHFLTWCAVESFLQIVAVVIPLEFAGVSIEGSRSALRVMLDKMVIALTVDHQDLGAGPLPPLSQQILHLRSWQIHHHPQ